MTSRTAPIEIPGWTHVYSGKVRDLYVPEESRYDAAGLTISDDAEVRAGSVMVVASDRISAFDKILPTEIPDKGAVLTQLSLWWFKQLGGRAKPRAFHGRAGRSGGASHDLQVAEYVPGGVHCPRVPDGVGAGDIP